MFLSNCRRLGNVWANKGGPWRCAKGPRLNTIKIDNYIELFHFHVHIGEVLRIYIIVANDGIIF